MEARAALARAALFLLLSRGAVAPPTCIACPTTTPCCRSSTSICYVGSVCCLQTQELCGTGCCTRGQCATSSGTCCSLATTPCGSACCTGVCLTSGSGAAVCCTAGQSLCGSTCCDTATTQECRTSSSGNPVCCAKTDSLCGASTSDPHFTGFDGTSFLFNGYEGATFALLADADHQVNALFGSIGPKEGVNSSIWMIGVGILYKDVLSFMVKIDAHPRQIVLLPDEDAIGRSTMRVQMPERAFHIEVNGAHRDDLLYSGEAFGGLGEGATLYFPPASAVNPFDARDGPIVVFKSDKLRITVLKETEGAAHLDIKADVMRMMDDAHGVLGQTLDWVVHGVPKGKVVGGLLTDKDSDYETPGLLAIDFKHRRFARSVLRMLPESLRRRLLTEGGGAAVPAGIKSAWASRRRA